MGKFRGGRYEEAMNLPPPDFRSDDEPSPRGVAVPVVKPLETVRTVSVPKAVREPEKVAEVRLESWPSLLEDTFVYPWRDHGWMILVPGGLMALAMGISSFGFLGTLSMVLIGGYFAAHYLNVIETTLTGRMSQPEWPDVSDVWSEVVGPVLRVFAVASFAAVPSLVFDWLAARSGTPDEIGWLLSAVGLALHCLYFPLAMVAVAIHGTLLAALPHRVLPALVRCSPTYWWGVFLLWLVTSLFSLAVGVLFTVPYLGGLLGACALVYFFVIHGRFCGLLYRRYEDRIGW